MRNCILDSDASSTVLSGSVTDSLKGPETLTMEVDPVNPGIVFKLALNPSNFRADALPELDLEIELDARRVVLRRMTCNLVDGDMCKPIIGRNIVKD